jgi:hypothetical protein
MDFKMEIIPACDSCRKAFRDPDLGWKLVDAYQVVEKGNDS